ncbi:MAG: TolC family protein [Muribaculaceae bacterium]|nr:TolC family protein [Muribaculaceae bacterium]
MNLHKIAITVLIGCTAFSSVRAEKWSLDSCISYAINNNIDVRRQNLQIKEGEQSVIEAKDRFLPSAEASASQNFNFGRGLTAQNTYADRNTSQFGWNAGLSLPLFQGMTEYRNLKVARLSLNQYLFEHEAAKDNITLNVIAQYLQVLYAKEVAESAKSQAEFSEFEVTRAKEMIDAGKVAEATLYDLEATLAQDKLQVLTANNEIRIALINLANLIQLKVADNFDIAPLEDYNPILPSAEEVIKVASANNNSILGAREAIKVADARILSAQSGYIPTLRFNAGLGSSYYRLSGFDNDGFRDQMKHNFSTYLGFSLSIPIFDGFSTRNNIRRAKLQKTTAQLNLEDREDNLFKDIRLAYYQALGAREKFMASEETLKKTRLSFDATLERFNLGKATQADYEQAKTNLFRTEIAGIQARYEYLLRRRILLFYNNP